jgi:LPS export ABC transporter protein LptC
MCGLVLAGCRLDYGRNMEVKALERNVPDMVVANSEYRIIRDDRLLMTLAVERAETYAEAGNRVMSGVHFIQYNQDGSVAARGSAGKAVQTIQSDDVRFSGGLSVDIASEKATITAESLDWTAEDKILRGPVGQAVGISKQNGSRIKGYGLYADLNGRTIELQGSVEGYIVND